MMEFHISKSARDKYQLEDTLFSFDGNIITADLYAVRLLTKKINAQKDLISFPEQAAKSSHVVAMGLIDEIFHYIFSLYREQINPDVWARGLEYLQSELGEIHRDELLEIFVSEYPPQQVFKKTLTVKEYLQSSTNSIDNRELVLEEFVMLWLMLENPALDAYRELFTEKRLVMDPRYQKMMRTIQLFFQQEPEFGPQNQRILGMLRTPAIQVPDSITGQLNYIKENWATLLGKYLLRLLTSIDLVNEENRLTFTGPGPVIIPMYDRQKLSGVGKPGYEPEAFSLDKEWMPRLVLMAKNAYVWLDQLSRKYQQSITRLDQIPYSELASLSSQGITGLWLIGIWERSPASAKIKQLCGNPDAISSAYSLKSYQIAADLGGEEAYVALHDNASKCRIRLASDMVPNHMGIDSDWVVDHPDWFLGLDHCPYPSYSFNGPDLSRDPNLTIKIEDHYYDQSDAAVIFLREDKRTGSRKHIYHGNDGTFMPWNDTAQLNYLNPAVREVVIQTIISVAKKFPIIRFDAAMTLAKKHVQRLWFPQPGSGGAIPSRSEFGMSIEEFDRAMPVEFWREVVDRVAAEAPDTLLLAEAFWLMEGYFVRTLGMHRVYNSAFMHMLRNEDNGGYRKIIRNTLEFEPEILKRYVNFMNNPDEKTAVEQFGKGDKYFGVCMLMATLPGLPMLGHGQVEGFAEKYGMEFKRAYLDEKPDENLIQRHEREIFPLLHLRSLFAEVENFWLYDFMTSGESISEDVYVFSNTKKDKSALVVYNNCMETTDGWIYNSVPKLIKTKSAKKQRQSSISEGLNLKNAKGDYVTFQDQITSLHYIRPLSQVQSQGFHFSLRGYEYHAFTDFEVLRNDLLHDYHLLYQYIGEQGVSDIELAMSELVLRPVNESFISIVNRNYLDYLMQKYRTSSISLDHLDYKEIYAKIQSFIIAVARRLDLEGNIDDLVQITVDQLSATFKLLNLESHLYLQGSKKLKAVIEYINQQLSNDVTRFPTLVAWALIAESGRLSNPEKIEENSVSTFEELQLSKTIANYLREIGADEERISLCILAIRISATYQNWLALNMKGLSVEFIKDLFSNPDIQNFLKVNWHQDILWYNQQRFRELTWWLLVIPLIKAISNPKIDASMQIETVLAIHEKLLKITTLESESEYQFEKMIDLVIENIKSN